MFDRSYFLGFSNFSGVGPIKFEKLIREFGSAKAAWYAPKEKLESIIGKSHAEKFEAFKKEFDFDSYLKCLVKQKISFVCLNENEYPKLLKQIPNPPIVLYVKGNVGVLSLVIPPASAHSRIADSALSGSPSTRTTPPLIAIVGTRRITSYGREITEMFARSLSEAGLTIVSGMAYGVDGVAHQATIDAGGKTIAVLGNGVDQAYPRENQKLYEDILDSGGLIISEYPPGTPPSAGSFPARNRIVAGLSDGVLVTEGAQDSGSLITANFGLEFDRKVFAVPGPITSSLSAAPLRLIEKGAKLVVSPDDILRELGIKNHELRKDAQKFASLSSEEKKIVELIENEALHFDEIVRCLKLDSSKVGTILSMMEIKGVIKNSGGNYSIVTP